MNRRLLVAIMLILMLVVAACGGDDTSQNDSPAAAADEEDRSVILLTATGDQEHVFESNGNMIMCLSEDEARGDDREFIFLSMSTGFLLYLGIPTEIIQQGTGSYPLTTQSVGDDEIAFSFEINERTFNGSGDIIIESLPAEVGDFFIVSIDAELTNFDDETIQLVGSVNRELSNESTLGCFS